MERTISNKSALKNLKLAFAFDDNLLIENKVIPIIADFNSFEFLGSIVQVVSTCDDGCGQIEIGVNYNYYFKDKNAVCKYHSGGKGFVKLKHKNARAFIKDNFIATFYI